MDTFNAMRIGASALTAQQIRLNTISSNLANIETTRTPEGGPYRKKSVVFQTQPVSFADRLDASMRSAVNGVQVSRIVSDTRPPEVRYDPNHPDARADGFVEYPNVNLMEEMADLMSARQAYDANVKTIQAAKRMALKAMEIGK